MENRYITDNLVCPYCHSQLVLQKDILLCQACDRHYPIIDGIPDFRQRDEYWCNVSREKMQELNRITRETGDWLGSAKKIVPQYADHFIPFDRADMQFIWPTTKDSIILDAGSMWGGLTIPAAQYHKQVYAVDKTLETLSFLRLRAEQMGFDNVYPIASGLRRLPFPDDYFDLVILSGVLEWVAFDQEVILEKHWGKRRDDKATYAENPKHMQLRVLRELSRVLKPGGCLYLAIENRTGYIYLMGRPDPHMNLPFVCFMPRFLANAITKWKLNCEYRTYIYTIPGYASLLRKGGFASVDFYGVFDHYHNPTEVVPLDLVKNLKEEKVSNMGRRARLVFKCIPKNLFKYFSPSVVAIAKKGSSPSSNGPRILQLLKQARLLDRHCAGTKIVKYHSRPGSDLTVNYLIYCDHKERPTFFCKICRSREATDILEDESKNLRTVNALLEGTELSSRIPRLLYFGTIDDVTFLVTEYVSGKTSEFRSCSRLATTNMKRFDEQIRMAIEFLASFQRHTTTKEVEAAPYLASTLEKQRNVLEERGCLTKEVETSIDRLKEELERLEGIYVPLCAIHGDFDLPYNMLFDERGVLIMDFEHFEPEGLPFVDLITLLFDPMLLSYEGQRENLSLQELLTVNNLSNYLAEWVALYTRLTGISGELLRLAAPLAALERKSRDYPYYRNPDTFPINQEPAFSELLEFRL